MADTIKLAYIAGFFDGEGSVGSYNRRHLVTISNTDIRPLQECSKLWGGKISVVLKSKVKNAHMDIYNWKLYGHNAKQFLEDILPFSIVKADQIKVFLSILEVLPKNKGEKRKEGVSDFIDNQAQKLRLLKKVGS